MRTILYISLLDWYFTKQRPQHFADLLSRSNNIIYCCRASWKSENLKKHDENERILNNFSIGKNLKIKRIKYLPLNKLKIISILNFYFYKITIKLMIKRFKPEILWITHPEQINLIPLEYNGKIIYDCMDNYSQFLNDTNNKKIINELEVKTINRVDLIITSSNGLYNKIININNTKKIVTIKNASDFFYFNSYYNTQHELKKPSEISNDKKIVGYFGGISSWFDVDLLLFIANKYKDCEFLLIGPISNKDILAKTSNTNNIKFIGPKIYKELALYLYYFDVCIMPFIINDLIRDVNPVKLYEYLSMGKPVVVTQYEEIKEFTDYLYLAYDYDEFSEKLGKALNEKKDNDLIEMRIDFARKNTWEKRVHEINELIDNLEIESL